MKPPPPRGSVSDEFRSGWDAGYTQARDDFLREKNPERWGRGFRPCPYPRHEDGEAFQTAPRGRYDVD